MADWRDQAECLDEDPELFFPIGNTGPALDQIEAAKAVCRRCPVTAACLSSALARGEEGVWGGLSEDERRFSEQLRRKRNAEYQRRSRARAAEAATALSA